jgi:type I restriction enzyme S subunit
VEPALELLHRIQEERYIKYQGRYREAVLPPHNPLPEMPQNWCSATLAQLSFFVTSGSRGWAQYYSDTGAIFIRAQDINTDQLKITEVAHVNLPEDAEVLDQE